MEFKYLEHKNRYVDINGGAILSLCILNKLCKVFLLQFLLVSNVVYCN